MDKYYKFYSLANEKKKQHLVDAITGKNIHMVLYTQVGTNDNKEGHFLLDKPLEKIFRQKLKKEKLTYLIGCASKRLDNTYMWKRFANDSKGACLAFTCADPHVKTYAITYTNTLPRMSVQEFDKLSLEEQACFALLHKRKETKKEKYWKEEEVRFLKKIFENESNNNMTISNITLYLGQNMETKDVEYWTKIANDSDIKVVTYLENNKMQ